MENKVHEIETAIKAAQDSASKALELKDTIEANKAEMEQKFDNVDATLAELKKQMEDKKEMKEETMEMTFKGIIESEEFKSGLANLKEGKASRFVTEVKTGTSAITGDVRTPLAPTLPLMQTAFAHSSVPGTLPIHSN